MFKFYPHSLIKIVFKTQEDNVKLNILIRFIILFYDDFLLTRKFHSKILIPIISKNNLGQFLFASYKLFRIMSEK